MNHPRHFHPLSGVALSLAALLNLFAALADPHPLRTVAAFGLAAAAGAVVALARSEDHA